MEYCNLEIYKMSISCCNDCFETAVENGEEYTGCYEDCNSKLSTIELIERERKWYADRGWKLWEDEKREHKETKEENNRMIKKLTSRISELENWKIENSGLMKCEKETNLIMANKRISELKEEMGDDLERWAEQEIMAQKEYNSLMDSHVGYEIECWKLKQKLREEEEKNIKLKEKLKEATHEDCGAIKDEFNNEYWNEI
jgi:hypothetical protein